MAEASSFTSASQESRAIHCGTGSCRKTHSRVCPKGEETLSSLAGVCVQSKTEGVRVLGSTGATA